MVVQHNQNYISNVNLDYSRYTRQSFALYALPNHL